MARRRTKTSKRSPGDASDAPHREESASVAPASARTVVLARRVERLIPHLVALCMFLVAIFPMLDPDIWWHLRTGRLIVEEKAIPVVDRYLFTDYDKPWVDLHWGFQVLMWGLYSLGGGDLLILTKAAVLALAVAIAWRASGDGLSGAARTAVWMPAVVCISGRALERPEMLTQVFLASWLWIAAHVERRPRLLWLLPALQVVWINCHALFVLGLVVGGCFAVDRVVREAVGGRFGIEPAPSEPGGRALAWCALLCGVAALCNPYFEEGALFPLELYKKFSVDQKFWRDFAQIGEFQRPADFLVKLKLRGYANIFVLSQLGLTIAAFASFGLLLKRRRWSPFRALLYGAFAHLGWEATRNVNIYAFVAAFVTLANFADFVRLGRAARSQPLDESTRAEDVPPTRTFAAAGLLATWALSICTGLWNNLGEDNRPFALGERQAWFAHDAMRFAGRPGMPEHALVGHIGLAGVYEFHHATERRVFVDPRLEVVTMATFEWYARIFVLMGRGDRRWENGLLDKKGRLPVVILDSRNSRPQIEGLLKTPGWRLVFADQAAAVFLENPRADALKLPPVSYAPLLRPP